MNKGLVTIGVIGFIVLLFGFNGCSSYNKMNGLEKNATAKWSEVENAYQRRSDLIPNLVAVVKNYADFEKSTLTAVVEARSNATKVTIDPSKLDEASIKKYREAQGAVTSTLGRLLAIAENYPDLKANTNFLDLQTQLEGTENRIANERKNFIEAVKEYNTSISMFPRKLWASMFGFKERASFQMTEGADKAPDVGTMFKDK